MKRHNWIGNTDRFKDEALLPKMMKVKENAKMKQKMERPPKEH